MTEINHTPGVCGGDACIGDTRIAVWLVAQCWNRLRDLDAVCEQMVWDGGINRDDVIAALDYYRAHPDEINQAIADNNRALNELKLQALSYGGPDPTDEEMAEVLEMTRWTGRLPWQQ